MLSNCVSSPYTKISVKNHRLWKNHLICQHLIFHFYHYPLACLKGNLRIATLLVEKGADVNLKDDEHHTPLHLSCQVSFYKKIIFRISKLFSDLFVSRIILSKGFFVKEIFNLVNYKKPKWPYIKVLKYDISWELLLLLFSKKWWFFFLVMTIFFLPLVMPKPSLA